jgi:hypothetical protein
MIKRFLVVLVLLFALCGCSGQADCDDVQSPETCTRVLFIGNSYTYVNDLPGTFAKLARSGGYQVETGMEASGGWTLSDQVASAETLNTLTGLAWDYVVLQEQSQIPSVEQSRTTSMYPAARSLVESIEQVGATPIFFLTWAHRDGYPENGMFTYEDMQTQISQGYLGIADELSVGVAPVGEVWWVAISLDPTLALWQEDGSHPSEQGTYLAACVFYAVIFRQNPEGLTYYGSLSEDTAGFLQSMAAQTVLNDPAEWNLP